VDAFNSWRAATFTASDDLCVDELMSRWYGLGGSWINTGLPHYVSIDRKPENGCEMWAMTCGHSGVMLHLEIVKGNEEDGPKLRFSDEVGHGTAVLLRFAEIWRRAGRCIYADSYFATVEAAVELYRRFRMYFTGVVKQCNSRYPKKLLDTIPLRTGMGESKTMLCHNAGIEIPVIAVLWCDRTRRTFVSTRGVTATCNPITRTRVRNNPDDPEGHTTVVVQQVIPQTDITATYYEFCGDVDRHNRARQDTLNLEKKVETREWTFRIITSIIGIIMVDAYRLYVGSRNPLITQKTLTQKEFIRLLCGELVDNHFDDGIAHKSLRQQVIESYEELDAAFATTSAPSIVMTNEVASENESRKLRKRCRECRHFKTMYVCSLCVPNAYVCIDVKGSDNICWNEHVKKFHSIDFE
jgi:hypothetical protein